MINKILVANRGEIACRVIKSIKKMGLKSVAIYSDADKNALHTKMADESFYVGESPSSKSYLVQEKIIDIAKLSGADAIHPGYGFLSENAEFARKLESNNIILIGPSAQAMEIMGSKLAAKDAVKSYNIPMIPGTDTALTHITEAKEIAKLTGYPLLIKASAGGGGKGMRIVEKQEELQEQINLAVSEAKSAFGDGSVFVEKYIGSPRHIEIQVLADNYGNTVYLFERECSIQRRHQKVVEEAPSSVLNEDLRKSMGKAAVMVAKSCNYSGVGTVEFLLDEDKNFYFLEMNTRLQVEHPVTEMITGIDLVEEQIKVAQGDRLTLQQDDLKINGHSIELRIYAEDPFNNFLPSISKLEKYSLKESNGVRLDNGIEEGMEIPIFYDPMLSKLVVHAENRAAAIDKMNEAISSFEIEGIESTLPFGAFVMNHQNFKSGDFDTHFVKKYFSKNTYEKMFQKKAEAGSILIEQLMKLEINKV